jgi:hypothetical protein
LSTFEHFDSLMRKSRDLWALPMLRRNKIRTPIEKTECGALLPTTLLVSPQSEARFPRIGDEVGFKSSGAFLEVSTGIWFSAFAAEQTPVERPTGK